MLAQWCFTAWNIAIGRPNCRRSFAYAAAISVHSRARPTASAERSTRARSTSARRAPGSTVAGAPSRVTRAERRVGSRFGGTSTLTPSPRFDHGDVVAHGNEQHVGEPAAEDVAGVARRCSTGERRLIPTSATAPFTEPSARPGSSSSATSDRRPRRAPRSTITVGTNGPGRDGPAELLDHDDELLEPVARAAVRLGHVQPEPAELDELAPPGRAAPRPAPRAVPGPQPRASRLVEEVASRLGERLVVFGDGDRHAASLPG